MIKNFCRVSGKQFEITESDLDFYRKMEIISPEDYEKLKSREILPNFFIVSFGDLRFQNIR